LKFLACSYFLNFSDESGLAIAHLFLAISALLLTHHASQTQQRFAIAFVQTP
jgi:hypothetical protein